MNIYYDNKFNVNEWFAIILLAAGLLVFLLPKRFPLSISIMLVLYEIAAGLFLDHIIGVVPIDYYDVNDSSKYEIFDFLMYCTYGPFSYLIIYLFDKLKFKKKHILFYIPIWSVISLGAEGLADKLGVFHYKNGYELFISFPIYLMLFSILFIIYFKLVRPALK